MKFFTKKKVQIPAQEKQSLEGIKTFTVEWTSRHGNYSNDVRQEFEVFLTLEDARKFRDALMDAFKLLRHTSRTDIRLITNE